MILSRSSCFSITFLICAFLHVSGQKPEMYFQTTHSASIDRATFSPDGKIVATAGGSDGTVKLWDVRTGLELRTFTGNRAYVKSIAFSADAKFLAGGSSDTVAVWNVQTGAKLHTILTDQGTIQGLAFSPDGSMIASAGSQGNTIMLWDLATGKHIRTLPGHSDQVDAVAFSHDGNLLCAGSWDKTVTFWNPHDGQLLKRLSRSDRVLALAFSKDDKALAIGEYNKISVLGVSDGREQTMAGTQKPIGIHGFRFSDDGSRLAVLDAFRLSEFDVKSGLEIKTSEVNPEVSILNWTPPKNSILALSPDWITLALSSKTTDGYNFLRLRNTTSQEDIDAVRRSVEVFLAVFSPDGRKIASSTWNKEVKLWDVNDHREIRTIAGFKNSIISLGFSADGNTLATVDGTNIRLWDVDTLREKMVLTGHSKAVPYIAFSQDVPLLASSSHDGTVKVWDLKSGKAIMNIHGGDPPLVALSADGKILATAQDEEIKLRYTDNGKEIKSLPVRNFSQQLAAQKVVMQMVPTIYNIGERSRRNKNFEVNKAENGQLVISEVGTKKHLATLMSFGERDWFVSTPNGFFDGTPSAWKQVLWRFDNNTLNYAPVEAFFKEFYRPGLLQEIISGNLPEAPKTDLATVDIRQPNVRIAAVDNQVTDAAKLGTLPKREVEIAVEVVDNNKPGRRPDHKPSSGAQDLRLFRGGSLVRHWKGDLFGKDSGCHVTPATNSEPRKAVCKTTVAITAGDNELSAYAFNSLNVKSTDATAVVKGDDSLKRKGKLHILAVGVNEYANKDHDLKYAVPDAVDFAVELRKRQIDLKNYDTPEVTQLTDAQATKKNILHVLERFTKGEKAVSLDNIPEELSKKFAAIEKVQPEDVVVIYFAGHGTAAKDRFYLIPHDGFPTTSGNDADRITYLHGHSISDLELEDALRDVDAGQMMMIVDACNSGQALEAEEKSRGPMNSRGLAQLAYEKGMLILTAAQSYQAALEVTRTPQGKKIEHGLLTYSLLDGLTDPAADRDGDKKLIDREWLNYAVQQVPQMQLEAMRTRDTAEIKPGETRGPKIFFANGDDKNLPPEKRGLQTPRVFYRRETSSRPLVVSTQ